MLTYLLGYYAQPANQNLRERLQSEVADKNMKTFPGVLKC